jgi:Mg-chelatase subunit ChlD
MSATENPVHIYFVLDRSGSMTAIRDDVVGGFNSFVDRQRGERGDCLMTLVQFDSADPFEVLLDARQLSTVRALAPGLPAAGGTPLYDAMGTRSRTRRSAPSSAPPPARTEEIVFVTFSDGQENASHEYDRTKVFEAIKKRGARLSFVFWAPTRTPTRRATRWASRRAPCRTSRATARGSVRRSTA